MQRKKRLFGRKTNRYFDYRIGAYNKRRLRFPAFLAVSVFMILATICSGYYAFVYKSVDVARADSVNPVTPQVSRLTQNQVDLKALESKEDETLAKKIQDKIDQMPSNTKWSISVRDLKSSKMANINATEQMTAASLYKLFLLSPLEKKTNAQYWNSRLTRKPIKDCVDMMIRLSDNDCALAIANYAGWRNINKMNKDLGFNDTNFTDTDDLKTTSKDVSELMFRLQRSQMLSDKARRTVFDALYQQKYRDGIPKGCGQDCLVADKVGFLNEYKHDAAIVTHGGAQYVVVIMSKNASWSQIAELASYIDYQMLP